MGVIIKGKCCCSCYTVETCACCGRLTLTAITLPRPQLVDMGGGVQQAECVRVCRSHLPAGYSGLPRVTKLVALTGLWRDIDESRGVHLPQLRVATVRVRIKKTWTERARGQCAALVASVRLFVGSVISAHLVQPVPAIVPTPREVAMPSR